MKKEQSTPANSATPAGYDSEGRPLYYRPASGQAAPRPSSMITSKPDSYDGQNFNPGLRTQHSNEPDLVHATRPLEPNVPAISDRLLKKHTLSIEQYPHLNLSEGEFVMMTIRRHPIGLLIPVITTALAVIILTTLALLVPDLYGSAEQSATTGSLALPGQGVITAVLLLLAFISVLVGAASVWVYLRNQFYLTNESVIQEMQYGLFSHREQTVSLGSIEDASYRRSGILQHLFDYGTIRLSTEGEETTYRFAFVEHPKEQIAVVSNAVEAFKNGRPVGDD